MQRVIAALRDAGIDRSDIQTQQIWISPQYSGSSLDGYIASNTVTARVRDIAKAGGVIDAAVAAGATNVYGPTLSRSDQQDLVRAALRAALANARAKAQAIAAGSGAVLGGVLSVVEQGALPPSVPVGGSSPGGGASPPVVAPTPFEPGQQETSATVSVTFAAS